MDQILSSVSNIVQDGFFTELYSVEPDIATIVSIDKMRSVFQTWFERPPTVADDDSRVGVGGAKPRVPIQQQGPKSDQSSSDITASLDCFERYHSFTCDEFMKMKMKELGPICTAFHLPTSGTKKALIDRLLAYFVEKFTPRCETASDQPTTAGVTYVKTAAAAVAQPSTANFNDLLMQKKRKKKATNATTLIKSVVAPTLIPVTRDAAGRRVYTEMGLVFNDADVVVGYIKGTAEGGGGEEEDSAVHDLDTEHISKCKQLNLEYVIPEFIEIAETSEKI